MFMYNKFGYIDSFTENGYSCTCCENGIGNNEAYKYREVFRVEKIDRRTQDEIK